jgi:predicted acyltransferase
MFWIIGGGALIRNLLDRFDHPAIEWVKVQMSHAEWEGFRTWDLIMPLFLFIVGVVMPFSFSKRLERGDSKKELYRHIIIRTLILFVLGMVAQGNLLEFNLSSLHIYCNTLQAIAAGYLISGILLLSMRPRYQLAATGGLLVLFWALMELVPVPEYGAGILEPGRNLAIYLDKLILGSFEDKTNYTWILSSITFACTVMLGVMAGHLLRLAKRDSVRILWLSAAGVWCVVLGSLWDVWFPIIKHLWTSSFVVFSAGWCYLLLALFYLVIDVWGFKRWAFFFVVIGMNAITAYMLPRVFDFHSIGVSLVGGLAKYYGDWRGFVHALAAFGILWFILWWMHRNKSFVKI